MAGGAVAPGSVLGGFVAGGSVAGGFVAGGCVAPGSDAGTVVVRFGNVGRVIPSDPHAASSNSREVAITAEQRRMHTSCRTTARNGSPSWGEDHGTASTNSRK